MKKTCTPSRGTDSSVWDTKNDVSRCMSPPIRDRVGHSVTVRLSNNQQFTEERRHRCRRLVQEMERLKENKEQNNIISKYFNSFLEPPVACATVR